MMLASMRASRIQFFWFGRAVQPSCRFVATPTDREHAGFLVRPPMRNHRCYPKQRGFFVEGMFVVPEPILQIGTVVSMPFDENSYIVQRTGHNDCIVIDPGFEPDAIADYVEKHSLTPAAILCTHGHSDHIAGNAE